MNYRDIVAVIIASSLGGSILASIIALAWRDKQLTETGGEVLMATVSGLLVALGYYMGSKNSHE